VPERLFTLDEARAALRELRPVAERMVELRVALHEAVGRRDALRATIGGNGGGIGATDVAERDAEVEQLEAAVAACVARIVSFGVQVKDPDSGLLDFPALRDGEVVLLCWRLGEPDIAFWHGLDAGFAGRKPLAEDE
jgi:hypothetical protein